MSRLATGAVVVGLILTGCGGGGGGSTGPPPPPPPPANSYDLQTAMAVLDTDSSRTPVNLSGTAMSGAGSSSFMGSGTLSLSSGASGMFNGGAALLQTTTVSGTIMMQGMSMSTPYSASVVNAYDTATGAILGESQSTEFDVAPAPIMIPSSIGAMPVVLGTLNRYTDSTLSVALGTIRISAGVELSSIDPGGQEVVQLTFKSYDMSGTLVATDTQSYYLTEDSVLSFYGATASNASGSLSVTPQ